MTRRPPPSRSPSASVGRRSALPPLAPFLLGTALWAAVSLGDSLLPPGPGEPLVGRWLRKLAEHPLRSSLALGLLLAAGWPRTGPRGRFRSPDDHPEVESRPESG